MTSFEDIANLMLINVPADYKTDASELVDIVKLGLLQYSIETGQTFTYIDTYEDGINETLGAKEKYVISIYSYIVYLTKLMDEMNRGAINFKTITFEVSTLQERVKSVRNMIIDQKASLRSVMDSYMASDEYQGSGSFIKGKVNQVGDSNIGWGCFH